MMLLLLVTMMALFGACSKKNDGGSTPVTCPSGYVLINNICQYNGGTTTGSSAIPSAYFAKNGSIEDGSMYRDFVYRYTFQYFNCWYSTPYSCNDAQVSLLKQSNDIYTLFVKSPMNSANSSYYPSAIPIQVRRVSTPTHSSGYIFEAVYTNPYPYVAIELWTHGDLTSSQTPYSLYFEGRQITTGTMRKGIDYL